MYPGSYVDVTHGTGELGKDLVVITKDELGDRLNSIIVKVGDIKGETEVRFEKSRNRLNKPSQTPSW